MRVITMIWALLGLSAVYILTVNSRDIQVFFVYLTEYAFAFLEASLMTPDLFMFFIYFLSFVTISRFYDKNHGISKKDYLVIYLSRVMKIVPMYYLIFFFGWQVYPLLSDTPGWFVTERFFQN